MNVNHLHNLAILSRRALPGCASAELAEAVAAILWAEQEVVRLKAEAMAAQAVSATPTEVEPKA